VLHQFHVQHSAQFEEGIFIQKVIANEKDLLVLIIDKQQASLLLDQNHFQCDMTFARVYGKVTEIVVAIFQEVVRKCEFSVSH